MIALLRTSASAHPAIDDCPWLALCACLIVAALSHATAAVAAEADEVQRPRIALVLGGGGARGAAHVGVLKVIEELHIPVDYVVGCSMGSIVGGLYASGMTLEQIEHEMLVMDWDDLFRDSPSRAERSFRRKRDDDFYVVKAKPGYRGGKLRIPPAYIRGQKFDLALNRLTMPMLEVKDFDRMPIPFRAVATDIETGQEVVLSGGSLAKSIRASMAVPAAFDPVAIDGRLLIDGGLSNNVPVSVAREMGADIFIVVDVGSGLYKRDELGSALQITEQLANFLFTLNTEPQLKTLGPQDILIRPQLGDITAGSFERAAEAIGSGESSARAAIESLRRYSLSEEDYAQHVAHRAQPDNKPPVVQFVRTNNRSGLSDEVIAAGISAKIGAPLDVTKLEKDIGQLYGLEIFESVRYDVVREDEQTGLLISATEKSWGPAFLQFGLSSSNDMNGNSTLGLGMIYTRTAINSLNGEWRAAVQIGDEPVLFTEIYQPLDPRLRYFVAGGIGFESTSVRIFDESGNNLARVQLNMYEVELGAGREFGTWGEGRLGYRRATGHAEVGIGPPMPDVDLDRGEVFLRLADDKLDNLNFPRAGHYGKLEWNVARETLGARRDYDQLQFNYAQAFSRGHNTLLGGLYAATTFDEDAPIEGLFSLGGLFRLSGLEENQLFGQHAGLLTIGYLRSLTPAGLLQPYLGATLEAGNVWQQRSDISFDDTIISGTVFFGMDTLIGPIYLAYGHSDTGESAIYIRLGPRLTF